MKNTSTSKIKEQIELMQTCCINLATGKHADYEDYESLRAEITSKPLIAKNLPDWLLECRYGSQYWSFIKSKSDTYQGRREFLWGEFGKLLDHIERIGVDPTSLSIDEILKHFNTDSVLEAWEKCFIRRVSDPEGAITAARTLLESTCKHILENLGETPDSSGDLPKLYKQTSMVINLSPSQYDEQIFKQILSGCGTVVDGLSSLRNRLSDAHGKGSRNIRPAKRHAELAVNLAGTISSFLIATYEEKHKK